MHKKIPFIIVLILILVCSCTTTAKAKGVEYQIVFDRKYYEDDKIKVMYVLGSEVFHLSIQNKTRTEIVLDVTKLAIISYEGETFLIDPESPKKVIPPRSKVVFTSDASVIFDSYNEGTGSGSKMRDWRDYKQYTGKRIRIYFPLFIFNTTQVFDIELKIVDIEPRGFNK